MLSENAMSAGVAYEVSILAHLAPLGLLLLTAGGASQFGRHFSLLSFEVAPLVRTDLIIASLSRERKQQRRAAGLDCLLSIEATAPTLRSAPIALDR